MEVTASLPVLHSRQLHWCPARDRAREPAPLARYAVGGLFQYRAHSHI